MGKTPGKFAVLNDRPRPGLVPDQGRSRRVGNAHLSESESESESKGMAGGCPLDKERNKIWDRAAGGGRAAFLMVGFRRIKDPGGEAMMDGDGPGPTAVRRLTSVPTWSLISMASWPRWKLAAIATKLAPSAMPRCSGGSPGKDLGLTRVSPQAEGIGRLHRPEPDRDRARPHRRGSAPLEG